MTQSLGIGGNRVIAPCDPSLDTAALSTLSKLRSLHANGPALHPGSIIMFGWAPLKLHDEGEGWVLYELDFAQPVPAWVRGISTTLRVLNQQAAVVHSFKAVPRQTRYDDVLLIEPAAESAPEVFLERRAPKSDRDSGWFVGVDGNDGSHTGPMTVSMAAVVASCAQWVPYLALPPGYRLIVRNGRLIHFFDPAGRKRQVRGQRTKFDEATPRART